MSAFTQGKVLNALTEHYAEIFGPKYAELYRKNIEGHRLAHDMTIEEYRAKPILLGFGAPPGPTVGDVKELAIPVSDGTTIPARVYHPQHLSGDTPLPCYINYHGGGWVIGEHGNDDAFNRSVVAHCNAIVVDVGYRLAPEHRFPVPVTDSWDAYRYVAEHASELGVNPHRLAVGGFSAGGHLSAVISQLARDNNYPYRPCFQLLVIPVCDASALDEKLEVANDCPYESWREHHDAPFLSHARMSWFYKYFLPPNMSRAEMQQPLLSPLHAHSLANLPPALVVPAEVDVLRDEGVTYARRLAKESGSWVQLWLARRVPHPFPHQLDATDVAKEFRALALQRLKEAFDGDLVGKTGFESNV